MWRLFSIALLLTGPAMGDKPVGASPSQFHDLSQYRIGSGDVIAVDVFKEPDASTTSTPVRSDGKVTLALIGEFQAAGLTPTELEAKLTAKYNEILRDPHVTVTVKEINSQKAYVIGQVKKEGPVRLDGPTTVLQALAEAGGVTIFAKRSKIYVLRTEAGHQRTFPFNYDNVIRGKNIEQNIELLPGDTIVIPE
jgi:polysaccharide export outer membrane protein